MRALVAVVLALAVLWGGYWFVGARFISTRAEALFADAAARGLVAERDDLSVRGFPNRFDLTIDGLRLSDPASGYGWEAPFVQVFAMSWKPWHLIAAFPPEQRILTPIGPVTVTAAKLQASALSRPTAALPLDRLTLVGSDVGLTTGTGVSLNAGEVRFATRDLDGTGLRHEVGLEVTDITPGGTNPTSAVERVRLDAELTFAAPLDRFALARPPVLMAMDLGEALIVWGDASAHASGQLTPDAAGFAQGEVQLRLQNWRQAVQAAVAAGLITPDNARTAESVLQAMARSSTDADTINVPLRLAGGMIRLGFIPLGPAPRFP